MKECSRTKCPNLNYRYDLCIKHYQLSPHGFVDSAPARDHLRHLRSRGHSMRKLAVVTGVSRFTMQNLEAGKYKTIRRRTQDAILAVPLLRQVIDADGLVLAIGTSRRIRALCAIGWSMDYIGDRIGGVPRAHVRRFTVAQHISAHRAAQVAALFNELQLTPGPGEVTRRRARAAGWALPLAWDEDTIDDPDARPDFGDGARNLADLIADERSLGRDDAEVARRWGLKLDTLQARLRRAGIPRTDQPAVPLDQELRSAS